MVMSQVMTTTTLTMTATMLLGEAEDAAAATDDDDDGDDDEGGYGQHRIMSMQHTFNYDNGSDDNTKNNTNVEGVVTTMA